MAGLDAALRKAAQKLYSRFGQPITVRKLTTTNYDTATGTSGVAYTDTEVVGRVEDFRAFQIDGTGIRTGDRRVTIPAADIADLQPQDRIIIDGQEFDIVQITRVTAVAEPAVYQVQVR